MKKLLVLVGTICLLFYNCKTYDPDKLPDTQLRFGSGGGITGMTTEYLLLKNGQVFTRASRAGSGEWRELDHVEKAEVRALYRTWENESVFKEDVQQPGNMYYFIAMKKDSLEYRQSWGASGYQPNESLKSFFDRAMNLVKVTPADPATR